MGKIKHAIISAAGLGSRLGLNTPKCLVKVNDKEIVYYLLQLLDDIEDVRIVVGFKEMDVINAVLKYRTDVTFVRNPDYATTSNAYSLFLASRDLKEPYITLDGDMIIDPDSFKLFLEECNKGNDLIGIASSKSEDAVFVELNELGEITQFQRHTPTSHEWCGIACFSRITVHQETRYVFNDIEKHMPVASFVIDCFEIDTPQDMSLLHEEGSELLRKYSVPNKGRNYL